ncbi:hypothetical protein NDU88_001531 [Pleurodeles waltl]|uniref:Uncharacterized protein n=1 Tax=Pleurodeles waltl TaxID=8319 RepID=A0AAV7TIZ2_PLEWA|nr:hypothetical protein NDU88_001531 [Pleurodeles waltl]
MLVIAGRCLGTFKFGRQEGVGGVCLEHPSHDPTNPGSQVEKEEDPNAGARDLTARTPTPEEDSKKGEMSISANGRQLKVSPCQPPLEQQRLSRALLLQTHSTMPLTKMSADPATFQKERGYGRCLVYCWLGGNVWGRAPQY